MLFEYLNCLHLFYYASFNLYFHFALFTQCFTFLFLEFENLFLLSEKYNNNCYLENCVQNL